MRAPHLSIAVAKPRDSLDRWNETGGRQDRLGKNYLWFNPTIMLNEGIWPQELNRLNDCRLASAANWTGNSELPSFNPCFIETKFLKWKLKIWQCRCSHSPLYSETEQSVILDEERQTISTVSGIMDDNEPSWADAIGVLLLFCDAIMLPPQILGIFSCFNETSWKTTRG